MDLGILNTIIAVVILLLVLSLLVQAVQTLIKKVLKLKSHQIESSLVDLYEQALADVTAAQSATPPSKTGLTRFTGFFQNRFGASANATTPADAFRDNVLQQFKDIGRKTLFGNAVLDSLSKNDLFKVIGKLESENFFPDYISKFQALCDRINDLRKAIEDITNNPALRASVGTKIAEIQSILAPIFNDVSAIVDGTQVKAGVRFADLLRLTKLDVPGLLDLLSEAQNAIAQEKEAAVAAGDTGEVAALQKLSDELAGAAKIIGDLSQKFVDAVSPLRQKLEQVEIWFDTITQSFDERYTRQMRTVSIVISIVVVILLNGNFFNVYRSLSTNEAQLNLVLNNGQALLEARKAQASNAQPASPPDAESPTASPEATPVTVEDIKETLAEIDSLSKSYQGFGFTPLSLQQVKGFLWSLGGWTAFTPNGSGWGMHYVSDANGATSWQALTPDQWWNSRKDNVVTLVGWAIMIMLLSVGAPFWQDTLESLFGIKNLLRQKSGTQNVENQSGAGQPRE